jgi:hypothetical protein
MADVPSLVPPTSFDYSALPADLARTVQAATARLHSVVKRTTQDIIEIGRDLRAVKSALGHGRFGTWLQVEFAMSESSADRFMRAASWAENRHVTNLPPTALYLLSARSTPRSVEDAVLAQMAAGATPRPAAIRSMVKDAKRARPQAEEGSTAAGHPPAQAQRGEERKRPAAAKTKALQRRERDAFAGEHRAIARDAKNVGDLEGALALFTELIEPVYLGAEDFVRERIEAEIRRILASLREKASQPRRELAPAGRA